MPYKSQAQERWAHTESGKKALGASGVKEWDSASKGLKLPQKVTEHPKHFEAHMADGGVVKIAKKGLGPKVLHRLTGMAMAAPVKMADGGVVPRDDEQGSRGEFGGDPGDGADPIMTPMDPMGGVGVNTVPETPMVPMPSDGIAQQAAGAPTLDSVPAASAPVAPAMPPPIVPGGGGYGGKEQRELKDAFGKVEAGQAEAARIQAEQGQKEAALLQAHQDATLAKQAIHDEQAKKIQAEIEKTEGEIKDGKIDPNHWYGSKDTGGKISAIFGMLLGGLGSGLTRGPNVALDLMNKQIDRDLATQKENLQTKNNLVAMYYKKLGNLDEATQRAKADMQAGLQVKMQQLGALAKGDVAKANLQMLSGQLQEQRLKLGSDLATAASARELQGIHSAIGRYQLGMAQTGAGQAQPDKALKDRMTFTTSAIAGAEKQLEHMEKSQATSHGVWSGVEGVLPGNRTASDWEAGRNLAVNELAKISKQGVPDKDEVERFLHTIPGPSASSSEKRNWIKSTREYLRGQKEALNQQFKRQGYRSPYPEVDGPVITEIK